MKAPRHPRATELFYELALAARARRFAVLVRKKIKPALLKRCAAPEPEARTDAEEDPPDDDDLARLFSELKETIARDLESGELPKVTDIASKRVLKNSQDEFDRLGIKLIEDEPKFGDLFDEWRKANVARITSIEEDQLDKVERILKNGQGLRYEALAEDLDYQIDDVTKSRAEFIARDQVLKLNGQITKERQGACGITQYVWTTANDERVRPEHEALEGSTQDWDDPPEINEDGDVGHPGDDFQCRCIAFALLPELGDEGSGESDESETEPDE